jgi:hypothetical protein
VTPGGHASRGLVVAKALGEGRQSDANSTRRDARCHSNFLIWPCKAECRVERGCAKHIVAGPGARDGYR